MWYFESKAGYKIEYTVISSRDDSYAEKTGMRPKVSMLFFS